MAIHLIKSLKCLHDVERKLVRSVWCVMYATNSEYGEVAHPLNKNFLAILFLAHLIILRIYQAKHF